MVKSGIRKRNYTSENFIKTWYLLEKNVVNGFTNVCTSTGMLFIFMMLVSIQIRNKLLEPSLTKSLKKKYQSLRKLYTSYINNQITQKELKQNFLSVVHTFHKNTEKVKPILLIGSFTLFYDIFINNKLDANQYVHTENFWLIDLLIESLGIKKIHATLFTLSIYYNLFRRIEEEFLDSSLEDPFFFKKLAAQLHINSFTKEAIKHSVRMLYYRYNPSQNSSFWGYLFSKASLSSYDRAKTIGPKIISLDELSYDNETKKYKPIDESFVRDDQENFYEEILDKIENSHDQRCNPIEKIENTFYAIYVAKFLLKNTPLAKRFLCGFVFTKTYNTIFYEKKQTAKVVYLTKENSFYNMLLYDYLHKPEVKEVKKNKRKNRGYKKILKVKTLLEGRIKNLLSEIQIAVENPKALPPVAINFLSPEGIKLFNSLTQDALYLIDFIKTTTNKFIEDDNSLDRISELPQTYALIELITEKPTSKFKYKIFLQHSPFYELFLNEKHISNMRSIIKNLNTISERLHDKRSSVLSNMRKILITHGVYASYKTIAQTVIETYCSLESKISKELCDIYTNFISVFTRPLIKNDDIANLFYMTEKNLFFLDRELDKHHATLTEKLYMLSKMYFYIYDNVYSEENKYALVNMNMELLIDRDYLETIWMNYSCGTFQKNNLHLKSKILYSVYNYFQHSGSLVPYSVFITNFECRNLEKIKTKVTYTKNNIECDDEIIKRIHSRLNGEITINTYLDIMSNLTRFRFSYDIQNGDRIIRQDLIKEIMSDINKSAVVGFLSLIVKNGRELSNKKCKTRGMPKKQEVYFLKYAFYQKTKILLTLEEIKVLFYNHNKLIKYVPHKIVRNTAASKYLSNEDKKFIFEFIKENKNLTLRQLRTLLITQHNKYVSTTTIWQMRKKIFDE